MQLAARARKVPRAGTQAYKASGANVSLAARRARRVYEAKSSALARRSTVQIVPHPLVIFFLACTESVRLIRSSVGSQVPNDSELSSWLYDGVGKCDLFAPFPSAIFMRRRFRSPTGYRCPFATRRLCSLTDGRRLILRTSSAPGRFTKLRTWRALVGQAESMRPDVEPCRRAAVMYLGSRHIKGRQQEGRRTNVHVCA